MHDVNAVVEVLNRQSTRPHWCVIIGATNSEFWPEEEARQRCTEFEKALPKYVSERFKYAEAKLIGDGGPIKTLQRRVGGFCDIYAVCSPGAKDLWDYLRSHDNDPLGLFLVKYPLDRVASIDHFLPYTKYTWVTEPPLPIADDTEELDPAFDLDDAETTIGPCVILKHATKGHGGECYELRSSDLKDLEIATVHDPFAQPDSFDSGYEDFGYDKKTICWEFQIHVLDFAGAVLAAIPRAPTTSKEQQFIDEWSNRLTTTWNVDSSPDPAGAPLWQDEYDPDSWPHGQDFPLDSCRWLYWSFRASRILMKQRYTFGAGEKISQDRVYEIGLKMFDIGKQKKGKVIPKNDLHKVTRTGVTWADKYAEWVGLEKIRDVD